MRQPCIGYLFRCVVALRGKPMYLTYYLVIYRKRHPHPRAPRGSGMGAAVSEIGTQEP